MKPVAISSRARIGVVAACGLFAVSACEADPTPYTFTDGGADNPASKGTPRRLDFEAAPPGALPGDFAHVLGDWAVEQDGPNRILRQRGEFETPDFPRIILKDVAFTNVHVKVRCSMQGGDTDKACGLMFRVQDSDNYYITRANTLEDNVRLYKVVGGARSQFGGVDMPVQAQAWHTYEAFAEGTRIRILFDGKEIISAEDSQFAKGKVGLWTKADSITAFDDFEATEL